MKQTLLSLIILTVISMSATDTFALPACGTGSKSCSRNCVWVGITWQTKWIGYAPHRAVTGPCLEIDAYNCSGTCASEYDMDWTGACVDYTGEVADRVTKNCI